MVNKKAILESLCFDYIFNCSTKSMHKSTLIDMRP